MITINKIFENCSAKLYIQNDLKDFYIGEITSHLQLADIRIKIRNENIQGYYLIYKSKTDKYDVKISIDKYGNLESWPNDFFDLYDKQLEDLLFNSKTDYEKYYDESNKI